MKERPILFSGAMVRAILDGRKTQTRRVVKPQPFEMHKFEHAIRACWSEREAPCFEPVLCPYGQVGDRLWVRETYMCEELKNGSDGIRFRADNAFILIENTQAADAWLLRPETKWDRWLPSIFMPRWASRITLEITGIKVERVQEISAQDADAEGTTSHYHCTEPTHLVDGTHRCDPIGDYRRIWDSINRKKYPWASNPWVWVIEFKQLTKE